MASRPKGYLISQTPRGAVLARRSEAKYCPLPLVAQGESERHERLSRALAKVTANIRRYTHATRVQQTIVYVAF